MPYKMEDWLLKYWSILMPYKMEEWFSKHWSIVSIILWILSVTCWTGFLYLELTE